MPIRTFSTSARRRIRSAVRWVEETRRPGRRPGPEPHHRGRDKFAIAEITASSSTEGYYRLAEVDGQGNALAGGRIWDGGAGNLPEARELNATTELETGTVVLLKRDVDGSGDPLWVFQGPGGESGDGLPNGGARYQALTIFTPPAADGVSGRVIGWDWVRAH